MPCVMPCAMPCLAIPAPQYRWCRKIALRKSGCQRRFRASHLASPILSGSPLPGRGQDVGCGAGIRTEMFDVKQLEALAASRGTVRATDGTGRPKTQNPPRLRDGTVGGSFSGSFIGCALPLSTLSMSTLSMSTLSIGCVLADVRCVSGKGRTGGLRQSVIQAASFSQCHAASLQSSSREKLMTRRPSGRVFRKASTSSTLPMGV